MTEHPYMAPQPGAETASTHKWSLRKHWVLFRKCRKLLTLKSISTPLPCYFANVPVEILISIFLHAVDGSNKTLFAVCGVCRRWREILFDVPHFWKNLILTGDSYWTPDKVDAWLRRAGGSLSRLYIRGGCKVLMEDGLFRRIPWSTLLELCIVDWSRSMKDFFLPETAGQLQVESLVLSFSDLPDFQGMTGTYPDFHAFHAMMETERAERVLPLDNVASSSLTKLELTGNFASSELLVLLDRNPMIERIVLADARTAVGEDPVVGASSIELVQLTYLELREYYFAERFLGLILFPSVRTLILNCVASIRIMATRRVPHLEEFQLSNSSYDHRHLIPLLRNALALKALLIRDCYGKADLVIQALAEVIPQGSATTSDAVGVLCCPQLQKVDLSQLRGLSSSTLLGLVRTRLNGAGNRKILRLYFYDTLPFSLSERDAEWLRTIYGTRFSLSERDEEWLRTNVPDFRYVGG